MLDLRSVQKDVLAIEKTHGFPLVSPKSKGTRHVQDLLLPKPLGMFPTTQWECRMELVAARRVRTIPAVGITYKAISAATLRIARHSAQSAAAVRQWSSFNLPRPKLAVSYGLVSRCMSVEVAILCA